MKKSKLFSLVLVLVIVSVFAAAASCNMCGLNISRGGSTEESAESSSDAESLQDSISDEEEKSESDEDSLTENETEDETQEETGEETEEETEDNNSSTAGEEAPTIKLQIYEGPEYSQADDVCYYRIEAIVTGNPSPSVTFSKDDSNGAFGSKKAQVNLTKSNPNYTLTVKAKSSAGEATASIDLSWGCGSLNSDPEIDKINITNPAISNTLYDVTVTASDPDGDNLSYEWTVSAGTAKGTESNPLKWQTPSDPGTYKITVKVSDGNGGEDSKSVDVVVKQGSITANLKIYESGETGTVLSDGGLYGWPLNVGDSLGDVSDRGYISFDISGLSGATIQSATFTANKTSGWNPAHLGELWVGVVDYGARALVAQDYNLPGIAIQSYPAGDSANITCSSTNLKTQLQNAINADKPRFQIRLHFSKPTDNDGANDMWIYYKEGINLSVTYTPK